MKDYEEKIMQAIKAGENIVLDVKPIYKGSSGVPVGVTIIAKGNKGYSLELTILNIK